MLIDSHIHVGQFFDRYYSPSFISRLMRSVGVDRYAVSSTSMCEEDYEKVIAEQSELTALDGHRAMPVMWITPEGLKGNIAWFLESDIQWRCLKIHPFMHQDQWMTDAGLLHEVVEIARYLGVPLLIHTGEDPCCHSGRYAPAIEANSDVTFILAHGRPIESAKRVVAAYGNAYIDTAFMQPADIMQFVDAGLSRKVLWGTDMCIPQHYYPHADMAQYYLSKLDAFRRMAEIEQFRQVCGQNAMQVFGLKDDA